VVDVGGNHHSAPSDLTPDQLGFKPLALGNVPHLVGNRSVPRTVGSVFGWSVSLKVVLSYFKLSASVRLPLLD